VFVTCRLHRSGHYCNGEYDNGTSHITWKGKYYPVEGNADRFVIELNDPYQFPVHNMELDTSYTVFHVNVGYDNLSVIDHRGAFIETYSKK